MRPHRRLRAPARGFTLIELMVVVVIIAILAALAVPLFVARFRERAVIQSAGAMADLFRGARTRALGRGAAVMVTASADGTVTVLEGVKGTTTATAEGVAQCGNLPTRGCTTNTWIVGAGAVIGTARSIGGVPASTKYTTAIKADTTDVSPLSVCFSPSGRTFVNKVGTFTPASWQPLTEVVTISLTSPDSGRTHDVVVLPNGTARLAL